MLKYALIDSLDPQYYSPENLNYFENLPDEAIQYHEVPTYGYGQQYKWDSATKNEVPNWMSDTSWRSNYF